MRQAMGTVEGPRELVPGWRTWRPTVPALLVAGCGQHASQQAAPPGGSGVAATATSAGAPARPPGAALAVAGSLFAGDSDQIRACLQTAAEVKPAKLDVQWSPDAVAVSEDEAMRSLVSISRDGSADHFDSRVPAVRRLKIGGILWIYDLAVRRVSRIDGADDIAADATPSPSDYTTKRTPPPTPLGAMSSTRSARRVRRARKSSSAAMMRWIPR